MLLSGLVLSLVVLVSAPAEAPRGLAVTPADLPPSLFVLPGSAVAYSVTGPSSARYQSVRLPLGLLAKPAGAAQTEYVLLAYSNNRYWPIPAQRQAGDLLAQVTPGPLYVVAEGTADPLRRALGVLCRFGRAEIHLDRRALVQRVCTQILCASEPVYGPALALEHGGWGIEPGTLPRVLGGWRTPPRDLCAACTAGLGTATLVPPTFECASAVSPSGCSQGVPLLQDDFEGDTAGAAPGSSPSGNPPDDVIASSGLVTVRSPGPWGTKAARLERGNSDTWLEGTLGAGASPTGSYCVSFKGFTEVGEVEVGVSLLSAEGRLAWRLVVGETSMRLVGGIEQLVSTATGPHQVQLEMNLDLGRIDLSVDGVLAAEGVPLLDADFGSPARLRFEYPAMMLEGFPGAYVVDDVAIRKTQ